MASGVPCVLPLLHLRLAGGGGGRKGLGGVFREGVLRGARFDSLCGRFLSSGQGLRFSAGRKHEWVCSQVFSSTTASSSGAFLAQRAASLHSLPKSKLPPFPKTATGTVSLTDAACPFQCLYKNLCIPYVQTKLT